MSDRLPPEVQRFVNKHVHGVSQLELLLHLHSEARPLTLAEAARALHMVEDQASVLLNDLQARGLVASDESEDVPTYRYAPGSKELAHQVDSLVRIYPTYRHSIIQLIFSKPPESVMNFSEAFRLRKDEENG